MEDSTDKCLNESMDEIHSFLDMELEALQSIYINELKVSTDEKCTTVSIDLHPSTADKLDEQYVRMTLQFTVEDEYPEKIPEIKIRNPRGLSDEKINSIVKDLLTIAENKKGNSMLFEMIDAAKEHLTVGNRPSGECAICLYGFSENDVFTKTECYHYFHSHCLARYTNNFMENSEDYETDAKSKSISNELLCPMCRIPIHFNASDVDYPPPEESDEDSFVLTEEILELQKKMADLYKKQVEKGGIIDIEAEKNKYLLEISNVPSRSNNEENSDQKLSTEGEIKVECKEESSDQVDSPSKDRRERTKDHYHKYDNRGKNRNYNRQNDSRGNYKYGQKYNRQAYDSSRGNYNRSKYVKNNSSSIHRPSEVTDWSVDSAKDVTTESDSAWMADSSWMADASSSNDLHDNISESSDRPAADVRSKHFSNSPRYNRNYRHDSDYRNHEKNYGNYSRYSSKRTDKSNYRESHRPQTSHRYSSVHSEEHSAGNLEEKNERTLDDGDENQKRNYRSSSYKHDGDFNFRERFSDSKNPQRGGKGAYSRRDNYSNAYNNYSRNKYSDREQYVERDNFRGRRNYNRDNRYRGGNDKAHYDTHNKQSSRNYFGNRQGKYPHRSYTESPNDCSESLEAIQNQGSNSISSHAQPMENEDSSRKHFSTSKRENKSVQKKEITHFDENHSNKLTEAKATQGNGLSAFPSVFNENPQVRSRTVNPPPGFANPLKKVIYGLQGANPPPGFNKS